MCYPKKGAFQKIIMRIRMFMKRLYFKVVILQSLVSLVAVAAPSLEAQTVEAQTVTVFASGLDSPRGLKFGPDGALHVAEAGRGGPAHRSENVGSDAVLDWNDTALAAIQTLDLPPPIASYCLAMAHAAIFDAVNSIIGDYQPYVARVSAPPGARAAAAAAQAGHDVLVAVMPPPVKSQLDSALQASLAQLPNDQHTQDGVTVGKLVASRLLALRSGDGPFLNPTYPFTQPPVGPGVWGPDYAPFFGVFAGVGQMQPFTMTSPSQFRPGPPPALTSDTFTQDFLEVKAFGSSNSVARTPDETNAAIWWEEIIGQITWNVAASSMSRAHGFDISQNARLFALLNMAGHDANVSVFDTKYNYMFWRPVQAIHRANTAGNPLLTPDPNWTPLLPTPPFPEYTSGHTTNAGASTGVLLAFFGNGYNPFSLTDNKANPPITRSFSSIGQAMEEVNNARVWVGFHYRHSDIQGERVGRQISRFALSHFLRAVHGNNPDPEADDEVSEEGSCSHGGSQSATGIPRAQQCSPPSVLQSPQPK
jgi:hypothetical protein